MSIKRSVFSSVVIPLKELCETSPALGNRRIPFDVDIIMFDSSPEALDEDVVQGASLAVHADRDAVGFKDACEFRAGELASLVRIEYFRIAILLQGFLQGFYAEAGVERG